MNAWAASSSTDIADRAAAILRDEIEHGALANITTASQIWAASRPTNVLEQALSSRVRDDIARVLDAVLGVLAPGTRGSDPDRPDPPLHRLQPLAAARPGTSAAIVSRLLNERPRQTELRFASTDLVSDTGHRIASDRVEIAPSVMRLQPHETARLDIRIRVPDNCPPGRYTGLLQAAGIPVVQAMLTLAVAS